MSLRRMLFLLGFCLLACTYALAQTETATLSGLITDPQGRPVPGVAVTVTNQETNVNVQRTTNDSGLYVAPGLKPGRYRVSITKDGFRRVDLTDLVLNVQDVLSRNFQLQLGPVTASITVVADEAKINTTDATVSTVVDRQFVENLPLNGRSFSTLIELTPGVVQTPATSAGAGGYSVNGQRDDTNYYTIDGVAGNVGAVPDTVLGRTGGLPAFSIIGGTSNLISIDALQEFRIQTSTFAPEFGRGQGAQVSVLSRSGTNQFHGTIFEYFRNDVLDATDWFVKHNNLQKPALRMNDFGGTLGGPIFKDRTFFFSSYEGLRLLEPRTATSQVPSLALRASTAPALQPFVNGFPIPNGPDFGNGLAQFSASYSQPSTLNAVSVRIDHSIGGRVALFGRYNYSPSELIARAPFGQSLNTVENARLRLQSFTLGMNALWSNNIANETRLNFTSNVAIGTDSLDSFGGATPPSLSLFLPSSVSTTTAIGRFFILISGLTGYQIGTGVNNVQRQLNFVDNISIQSGSHEIKIGGDYRRLFPRYSPYTYQIIPFFFSVSQLQNNTPLFTRILGTTGSLYPVFSNFSAFAQDTWKALPNLTVTYGVRWDYNPAPHESNGNDAFAVIGADNPSTMALAPIGRPLWKAAKDNFAPRLGISYRPGGAGATVIRAGVGMFFDVGYGDAADGFTSTYVPQKFVFGQPFPLDAVSGAPPEFSTSGPFPFLVLTDPDHHKSPYTIQWSAAVEQGLGRSQSISLTYLGSRGKFLPRQEVLVAPNATINFALLNRNLSASSYDALQIQFRRQLSRGLQALASYTWAHSIDDASTDFGFNLPSNVASARENRGSSDFDVRHSMSAALSYSIPALGHGVLKDILRDWSVDSILHIRSGLPFNVVTPGDAFNAGLIGFGLSRPDLVPGEPIWVSDPTVAAGRRLNPNAFTDPLTRQGNLGRNAISGYGFWQSDFGIRREFSILERLKLRFKAEMFNLFNHPNFANPGAAFSGTNILGNPMFGQATLMYGSSLNPIGVNGGPNPVFQSGGPRNVQFSLKFLF